VSTSSEIEDIEDDFENINLFGFSQAKIPKLIEVSYEKEKEHKLYP